MGVSGSAHHRQVKQQALLHQEPRVWKVARGKALVTCWCGNTERFEFPYPSYNIGPGLTFTMEKPCWDCNSPLHVSWYADELI